MSILKLSDHLALENDAMEDLRPMPRKDKRLLPKTFVGWDSEGSNVDASIFLFGSSAGHRIAKPNISTIDVLELLLQAQNENPNCIHIIYGADYDFNMFLRDLPEYHLRILADFGEVRWKEYYIGYIPRKWFSVSREGMKKVKVYDIVSFFGCTYVQALLEHGIGSQEQLDLIIAGKKERSSFTYEDLNYIEPYWLTELELLPQLADKLRTVFESAGMFLKSWHGPGALANCILKNHRIEAVQKQTPESVHLAARYAFAGGRFEPFQAGLYEDTVYNADINSAYPYAATFLPNLATGKWFYTNTVDRQSITQTGFALYRVHYDLPLDRRDKWQYGPQPFFCRYRDDRIVWPTKVNTWAWSPEAYTMRNSAYVEFSEAYVYQDDGSRPFEFLNEYYHIRQKLKALGDPTQLAFKLGPNSVYGQLAQRAGWKRQIPKFHQIEMAGFITSICRAMIYEAAKKAFYRGELISCDTDGIFTTGPIPQEDLYNGYGDGLGQWDLSDVPGMLFWQSGVYYLMDSETKEWKVKKARGAPKAQVPFDKAIEAMHDGLRDIRYSRYEFLGMKYCLHTHNMKQWRYFVEKERILQFGGSPFSKRIHIANNCRKCRYDNKPMHDLQLNMIPLQYDSHMHNIPWESNDHDRPKEWSDLKAETVIDEDWEDEL